VQTPLALTCIVNVKDTLHDLHVCAQMNCMSRGCPLTSSPLTVILNVKMDNIPSEDVHARIAPSSYGAQHTEFTEAVCRVCSFTFAQELFKEPCSCYPLQIHTLPSYECGTRMWPQATCQTGFQSMTAR
jgi:hypothetical protein